MRGLVGVLGGIAFDDRTGRFIVTDRASGLISKHMSPSPVVVLSMNCRYAVTLTGDASSKRPLIEPFPLSEQDSRRLKGPCDVTVATDGSIFFSDTGADGTHGIQNPRGSICRIAPAGDRLHAAYPKPCSLRLENPLRLPRRGPALCCMLWSVLEPNADFRGILPVAWILPAITFPQVGNVIAGSFAGLGWASIRDRN